MTVRLTGAALLAAALFAPALAQSPAPQAPKEPFTRTTPAPNETPSTTPAASPVTPDYPLATFVPATPSNYTVADRPASGEINMVLIHDIEGSGEACLSWFQNPAAKATSHYVTNSKGQVWQMVKEKDVAWHAGNWEINQHSVGIENEGFAYRPGFFVPSEYEGLAKLVRDITARYKIPRDRQHIIGHSEVPNPNKPGAFGGGGGHTDPGPYWDWDSFMTMVRNDARIVSRDIPATIRPGELLPASVKVMNTGDDAWTANNSGAQDEKVKQNGGVYLGVYPTGDASPFFNYKFWTSPKMASSLTNGDTAQGTEGAFSFQLLGPRKYGVYEQKYRVTHYPVAPFTPTAFGEILTATTTVVPWEIVVSAKDAKPAVGWNSKDGVAWRKTTKEAGGAGFEWTAKLPIKGTWDVYARWSPGMSHTRKATFNVSGDANVNPTPVTVDQRKGGGWWKLGRFDYQKVDAVTVNLSAAGAPGVVVADSIRLVGPFEK
ncbi:MAG TPA: N-acetylmuramoyl-L-alanine amidase [Armatimonadota bacterium]|jgi:hypothetical protein